VVAPNNLERAAVLDPFSQQGEMLGGELDVPGPLHRAPL